MIYGIRVKYERIMVFEARGNVLHDTVSVASDLLFIDNWKWISDISTILASWVNKSNYAFEHSYTKIWKILWKKNIIFKNNFYIANCELMECY